jgi:hypothetical protein
MVGSGGVRAVNRSAIPARIAPRAGPLAKGITRFPMFLNPV